MARLQDYQTVTPSPSDKLLIVQSQGQGLTALKDIAVNNLNGTLESGSSIRGLLVDTSIPKGMYFYNTRYASDNPASGTITTTMIYKNNANGTYSRCYCFARDSIYYAESSSSVPSTLSWTKIVSTETNITTQCTWNEDYANARVTEKAGVVYITYQGEGTTHSADDIIFTIPQGYRPLTNVFIPVVCNAGAYGNIIINTGGQARLNQISSSTFSGRLYFTCSYPIS